MDKKVLLFSNNPVPTETYKTVEGSALRFWRMALALQANGFNDITIAIWKKFPQEVGTVQGIKIINFSNKIKKLSELMRGYDTVIFSCALGDLSRILLKAASDKNQVIIDAYSPVYVEIMTKSSDEREDKEELKNYSYYVDVFNECLTKADYALVANNNQKHLYRGVLAAQEALIDYDDSVFVNLPAFVEASPNVKQKVLKKDERISVLWFGGVYPWFDISDIVEAFADPGIKKLAKLVVVGGSNPFYPKDSIRFNGKFIKAKELSDNLGLTNETVFFEDWVEYYDRIKIFNESDVAISVNSQTIENEYSFRLRVADLVGNGLPVITNAGDPLGDELVKSGVAFKLEIASKDLIRDGLKKILSNHSLINEAKKKLNDKKLYRDLHINGYIGNLARVINRGERPRLNRHSVSKDRNAQLRMIIDRTSTMTLIKLTTERLGRAAVARSKRIIKK